MSNIPEQHIYRLDFTPAAYAVYQAHALEQINMDFARQRQPRPQYIEVLENDGPSITLDGMLDVRLVVNELEQFSANTHTSAVRIFDQSPSVPVGIVLMEDRKGQGIIAAKLAGKLAFQADVIETMGEL